MPADVQKLVKNKEVIVNSISRNGPSLPVQVARQAGISLLFASAYLSELYNERKIKMSSMKVGSSQLYFLDGQEAQLENFIQYLNHKEREAFNRLKNEKILEDDKMEPAIRVALRAIRDFASPVKIKIEDDSKLFWKYYLLNDEELRTIAQDRLAPKKHKKQEKIQEENLESQKTLENKEDKPIEKIKENIAHIEKEVEEIKVKDNELDALKNKKEKKIKVVEESRFSKYIKEYLSSKNIEVLNIIEEKKNALSARVRIEMIFGKQEFLLMAKDKKKVSEEDLIISLQKAGEEKMPALILCPGDIDKKAIDFAKNYRNLIKFQKIDF